MTNKYNSLLKTLKKTEYSLDKNIVNNHCVDWRGNYRGSSEIIFFPKSLTSIQKIVKFCFKKKIFQSFHKVVIQALLVDQFLDLTKGR